MPLVNFKIPSVANFDFSKLATLKFPKLKFPDFNKLVPFKLPSATNETGYLTLDHFKYNISNIVRPNKFVIIVEAPEEVTKQINSTKIMFHAVSATIPDRNFNEIEMKYYGMSYKLPGGENVQDLVVNYICDEEWVVRDFFEYWANLIQNRETNNKGYAQDLFKIAAIRVYVFNHKNETICGYRFVNPFPKTIDQIDLSQETFDSHATFNVTFGYSYWERL